MTSQKRATARTLTPSPKVTDESASSPSFRNRLLSQLTPRAHAAFDAECDFVELASGQILYEPGSRIDHLYFPETCVASMVRRMENGSGVEVGIVGIDGVTGISAVLGATTMPTQCLIQIPGKARRISTEALMSAIKRPSLKTADGRPMLALLHLYSQALFEQVAQSAACNRLHSLEQRCARWLLMTHDRTPGDELALTQEFLSYMLGVRRAGVTEAAGSLQRSGLINYRHGRIRVRDRVGLEAVSCECYRVGVSAYRTLLGGGQGN